MSQERVTRVEVASCHACLAEACAALLRARHHLISHFQALQHMMELPAPGTNVDSRFSAQHGSMESGEIIEVVDALSKLIDGLEQLMSGTVREPDTFTPHRNTAPEFRRALRSKIRRHPKVKAAVAYIDTSYGSNNLRLNDVARQAQLSPYHLERLLKIHTGATFAKYLHGVRIAKAKEMLAVGTYSIKEIAGATGFASTSTFDRAFKRTIGCSPSQWRTVLDNAEGWLDQAAINTPER